MSQLKITRKRHFMEAGLCPDCKFLVGADYGEQAEEFFGHKIIFADGSPVFKNMFFGSIPAEGDIKLPDIHPNIFRAIMSFFYAGEVIIASTDEAFGLWCAADKYIIEDIMEVLPDYLIKNIKLQNVFSILWFSISHRKEIVIKNCCKMILSQIATILEDSTALDTVFSALSFILDQEEFYLSEVNLYKTIVLYDIARKSNRSDAESEHLPLTTAETVPEDTEAKERSDGGFGDEGSSIQAVTGAQGRIEAIAANPVRELLKKVRFLSMTAEEFLQCTRMSSLISPLEATNILANITDPTVRTNPMPGGFCTVREQRDLKADSPVIQKFYCRHTYWLGEFTKITASGNHQYFLHFKCNVKIALTGVKLNVKNRKVEYTIVVLKDDEELLYQVGTAEESLALAEIPLSRPITIDPEIYFTIRLLYLKEEHTPEVRFCKCECLPANTAVDVTFTTGRPGHACMCKGFINSIIFTTL